jgi:hypothetical protein
MQGCSLHTSSVLYRVDLGMRDISMLFIIGDPRVVCVLAHGMSHHVRPAVINDVRVVAMKHFFVFVHLSCCVTVRPPS